MRRAMVGADTWNDATITTQIHLAAARAHTRSVVGGRRSVALAVLPCRAVVEIRPWGVRKLRHRDTPSASVWSYVAEAPHGTADPAATHCDGSTAWASAIPRP